MARMFIAPAAKYANNSATLSIEDRTTVRSFFVFTSAPFELSKKNRTIAAKAVVRLKGWIRWLLDARPALPSRPSE
jgi:hypothetical protein